MTDTASVAAPREARLLLTAGFLVLFMGALEQTITGPAMGDIAAQLGGGSLLAWVATAYLLAATVTAPIIGAVADLRGRRMAMLLSIVLFLAGAVGSALAPHLLVLVIARAVQGAGAGGLMALPFVLIADLVPFNRRALYSAYISTIFAIASMVGPVAGGALSEYIHWSAVFWINLPVGALAVVAVLAGGRTGAARRDRRIDVPGALLLTVAAGACVLGLDRLSQPGGTAPALGWLALALAGGLGFAWRSRTAAEPLVPLTVMTHASIRWATLGLFCVQGSNVGLAIYLPLYYQVTFGFSASHAGYALLGFVGGIMLGAYAPPQLLLRNPRYRPLMRLSALWAALSALGLTALLAVEAGFWWIEAGTVVMGLAMGMLYPTFALVVQNVTSGAEMGRAMGMLGFMRAMGGTVGVSAVGIAAVASGLTHQAGAALWPVWTIGLAAAGLLTLCLIACLRLPAGELKGYATKS